jgi:hypothetical protein
MCSELSYSLITLFVLLFMGRNSHEVLCTTAVDHYADIFSPALSVPSHRGQALSIILARSYSNSGNLDRFVIYIQSSTPG